MRALNEDFPQPPFEGFPPDALAFFRELAGNMDKAWFAANKPRYERSVRDPLQALVGALSQGLEEAGLPFRGDPKRSVFRVNRDVRFSNDKSPYKTHASCALTRSGDKMSPGVLYFHLDPLGSFAASGFYAPEPDALHRMRLGIVDNPKGWAKVVAALGKTGLEPSRDEVLVRPPKGFNDAPPQVSDALKLKSWVVSRPIPDKELVGPSLVKTLVRLAQDAEPLLRFGWLALDRRGPAQSIKPARTRR
jgi:uncharacterized protein (TIGR02453 family)